MERPEGFTRSQIKSGLSSGSYQVAGKESAEARQCVVLFGTRLMNLTLPCTAVLQAAPFPFDKHRAGRAGLLLCGIHRVL